MSCEGDLAGCPTQYQGTPIATIKIFGTRVTVYDPTAPSLKVGGPLQQPGWHKASECSPTTPRTTRDPRGAPCPWGPHSSGRRRLRLPPHGPLRGAAQCGPQVPVGTPDGTYNARIVAEDASGNETRHRAHDPGGRHAPHRAGIIRTKGRRIVLKVSDPASGLAGAKLEVRRHGNEAYRTLNATIKHGKLRAKVDKGKAAKLDMRLTLRDNAGNVAQGNPTRLTATRARVGRRISTTSAQVDSSSRLVGRRGSAAASRSLPASPLRARRSSRPRGYARKAQRQRRREPRSPIGTDASRLASRLAPAARTASRSGGPAARWPTRATSRSGCRRRAQSERRARTSRAAASASPAICAAAACVSRAASWSCSRAAKAGSGARLRTRGPRARAAGTSPTASADDQGAIRSAYGSAARLASRSSSATRTGSTIRVG